MQRQHTGRAGTAVIPDGWAAAHAPVVTATFDCTVSIGGAGTAAAWNEDRGQTETTPAAAAYAGAASVGLVSTSDGTRLDVVDDQVNQRAYEIKIPAGGGAAIAVGQLVLVVASPNPALPGARMHVTSVARPGREFSRVLYATLDD